MTCISKVDDSRCLLGDANGRLHMLFLEMEEKMDAEATTVATETKQAFGVANLKLELLGEVREKLG